MKLHTPILWEIESYKVGTVAYRINTILDPYNNFCSELNRWDSWDKIEAYHETVREQYHQKEADRIRQVENIKKSKIKLVESN